MDRKKHILGYHCQTCGGPVPFCATKYILYCSDQCEKSAVKPILSNAQKWVEAHPLPYPTIQTKRLLIHAYEAGQRDCNCHDFIQGT